MVTLMGLALGLCASIAYAGSSQTARNYFYADTDGGGVIRCGSGWGKIESYVPGLPSSNVRFTSETHSHRDVFCANDDTYPANYLFANVTLFRANGSFCTQSGWVGNPVSTAAMELQGTYNVSPCGGQRNYYTFAEQENAINFGWRYGNETTSSIQGG